MSQAKDLTTEADIEAAMERSSRFDQVPRARNAYYNAEADVVVIRLTNGRRFVIPREELRGLEKATVAERSEIEIYGGLNLAWPRLDVDHYLPYHLQKNYEYATLMRDLQCDAVAA